MVSLSKPPFLAIDFIPGFACGPRTQNRNFKANWICREVPTIDVIVPALGFGAPLLVKAPRVVDGKLKLVWFRILKNSARNWTAAASEILVSFARLMSRVE